MLIERLRQAADFCEPGAPCDPAVTNALREVRTNLAGIADALAVHLPARYAPEPPAPAEDPATLLARAADYYRTGQAFAASDDPALAGVAALLTSVYPAAQARQDDPRTLARLVDSVLRPLAEVLPAPSAPPATPPHAPQPPTTLHPRSPSRHSGTSPSQQPPCAPVSPPRPRPACSRQPRRCRTSRSSRPPPGSNRSASLISASSSASCRPP